MADEDNTPYLISVKPLKSEYDHLKKIVLTSENFTIGRNMAMSAVIACISISRHHCTFKKSENNCWYILDHSSYGISINDRKAEKDTPRRLSHGDILFLEGTGQFVYKFNDPNDDLFEIPTKRIRLEEKIDNHILKNVKKKFEESQNFEIKHIEDKIQSAKQLQTTSINLKQQLQLDMDRKVQQLESNFAQQIVNLKGKKNEVLKQKALLIKERDEQLAQVKNEMNGKIEELMEQIKKHNETESELLKENNLLKEKLNKEREEFLSELSRESSSKQDMLDKLEAKMREQEEVRLKEKKELEQTLKRETEQLRLAQEIELKEIAEQKRQRELELQEELDNMKKAFQKKVEQTEEQRVNAEKQLNLQMKQLKKLSDEEKIKMEQLQKEREQIQNQLLEAQQNAEKSLAELRERVTERETELALLAAERIQHQAEQSSEVITTLQEQLEKMKNRLESVETEKTTLELAFSDQEGPAKQTTLTKVGELMESELQCSICAELFIDALVLNCSHTFCKYCITMWKKKKKDCPICRSLITSENKSLVLDNFIEKMVQNLTDEMKEKRQEILKFRAELVSEMAHQTAGTSRASFSFDESEISDEEFFEEGEEEDDEFERQLYDVGFYQNRYYNESTDDTDSGSDDVADTDQSGGEAADVAARVTTARADLDGADEPAAPSVADAENLASSTAGGGSANRGRRRRRGSVAGVPGSYYGGYGRCFSCGARGHWAPGCPFR